ncbi:diacylglycerol kinase [Vibrio breoganii]|uniref:Diacylglycerol kinase n=2 Tax=Vibrio TaxID=662 RepID=A0AAJ5EIQ5_9VIBR|nr:MULTISPECIES: diacylglycerol kinase [Vibrio]ANO33982.1 diacylglycerol kinase [Vibrio breoganii]MDN3717376.1 diacylglycerol kinase [Vibrio breoganii]OCH72976.1 diacylglycerol kinase [Vibrio breoganii]OED89016.1 diacylglycerol kinase [Vibrio breoganii ZF-55]OED95444.1 diacylglycerol kinase [Vibrio breoganii ZF-29]
MKGNTGFKRVIKATGYSIQGLKAAFKHEAAFRQEVFLALFLIPIACILDVSQTERMLMILSLFIVLIAELMNSAVEAVVDRIGSEIHELAGRAKDIGSAAVFVALGLVLYIWVEVLFF